MGTEFIFIQQVSVQLSCNKYKYKFKYKYKYLLCDTKDPVELNKLEQLKGFVVVEV